MRIRRLAVPDGGQVSASHAAARYLQKVLPSERPVVALIGSGKMARLAAEALRPRARLLIAHRDPRKAREAAARLEGEPVPLRSIARILRDADAVLAATSSGSPVVRRETVAQAMAARGGRPLWLVDLGFPRNVDPSSGTVPGVTLLNIDDLAPWAWRPPDPAALARAERAIREEAVLAINALRPGPADFVANWRRAANEWRRREIEQALARLPGASQEEREIVEKMADRLTNRILHAPTSLLRRMQAEGQTALVAELLGAWRDLEGTE
jgi:glutamyl-tRNA reductase